jgi:D-arabinose 1-dehydrogenase-like Zn-dependent alcohol dehydrogenase
MCLGLLKAMGGKGAIVVDTDPAKREAAMRAGALAAIDGASSDAVKQVTAAAKNGVWAAIDFVGASSTAKLAIDSLTKGGKLVLVGLFGGDITLSLPFIPMRAITIQGAYVGSLAEAKELLDLVKRTHPPSIPITTRALAAADATLQDLRAGRVVGRAVLTP